MNRFRADLILLIVSRVWGSGFAVQRVAAQYFDVFTFNGLRFLMGGLILLPFSKMNPLSKANRKPTRIIREGGILTPSRGLDSKSIIFIILAGGLLFGAAGLQQAGLGTTTAGNAGFITTLYVVLVPVILVVFWREKIYWLSWLGAGIAIIGSLLLSTGGSFHMAYGDALELAGALLWARPAILINWALKQTH